MAWAYSVDLRERVMSALGTRRTARLRNSSKLARPRSTPMEATASGDGQPGAASPQEREPNAGGARAVGPGKGDRQGEARPDQIAQEFLSATEQAGPRIQKLRRRFIEVAKSLDPHRLVFLDGSGSHIAMTRDNARAPCGDRALGYVPRSSGTVITMMGGLHFKGVRAMMTIEGATDAEVSETFVERALARELRLGDIVVLDDVGTRKVPNARREAAGASLLFLPLCSLDLNPIELCRRKLKSILTDLSARIQRALDGAIRRAMGLIGSDDAVASFTHCGCGAGRVLEPMKAREGYRTPPGK